MWRQTLYDNIFIALTKRSLKSIVEDYKNIEISEVVTDAHYGHYRWMAAWFLP